MIAIAIGAGLLLLLILIIALVIVLLRGRGAAEDEFASEELDVTYGPEPGWSPGPTDPGTPVVAMTTSLFAMISSRLEARPPTSSRRLTASGSRSVPYTGCSNRCINISEIANPAAPSPI